MGGKDAIAAMGDLDNVVYKALDKEKLFDPDVLKHSLFDKYDCSRILQAALTTTMTALQKKMRLEDRQHSGKRKAPEAGAEISGMDAEVEEKHRSPHRVQAQLTEVVSRSTKHKSLNKKQLQALNKTVRSSGFHPGTNKFKELEVKVEACALILSNGERLNEPSLKEKIKTL